MTNSKGFKEGNQVRIPAKNEYKALLLYFPPNKILLEEIKYENIVKRL